MCHDITNGFLVGQILKIFRKKITVYKGEFTIRRWVHNTKRSIINRTEKRTIYEQEYIMAENYRY